MAQPALLVIRDLRAGDYADDELVWYEDSGRAVAQLACLFYGFLLGLDESGLLEEPDRVLAEAILPGFMMRELNRLAEGSTLGEGDA